MLRLHRGNLYIFTILWIVSVRVAVLYSEGISPWTLQWNLGVWEIICWKYLESVSIDRCTLYIGAITPHVTPLNLFLLLNQLECTKKVCWFGEWDGNNVRLLKLVSLLSFFCGYFLAISGLFGLHHNGLFTFGLSDWTTRTIGLSQFVLKRLLDYSNWTYGSSGLSKFGLHSK